MKNAFKGFRTTTIHIVHNTYRPQMIFVGREKAIVDQIISGAYNNNTANGLELNLKPIFTETFYGIRFAPFVFETIKRTHKTLGYALRQQFPGAKEIFEVLLKPDINSLQNNISGYCFGVWDRIRTCDKTYAANIALYYKHVRNTIIIPIFQKFGYYSPTMLIVVFIDLLLLMGELYVHDAYALVFKHFVKDRYPIQLIQHMVVCLSFGLDTNMNEVSLDLELFKIEQAIWQTKKM
jgi:hypothetical protein